MCGLDLFCCVCCSAKTCANICISQEYGCTYIFCGANKSFCFVSILLKFLAATIIVFGGIFPSATALYINRFYDLTPSFDWISLGLIVVVITVIMFWIMIPVRNLRSRHPQEDIAMLRRNWTFVYICYFLLAMSVILSMGHAIISTGRRTKEQWNHELIQITINFMTGQLFDKLFTDKIDTITPYTTLITIVSLIGAGYCIYFSNWARFQEEEHNSTVMDVDH